MGKIVEFEGIGEVLIERSKRAKYINISVRPFRPVRVAVPWGVSYAQGEKFLREREDWVRKNLRKIKRVEDKRNEDENALEQIDWPRAGEVLGRRIQELADFHGFEFNRVTLRNQKTRWGSCSADNNISLNVRLVLLPPELRDYVILHELVHTRVKNHSRRFWAELDKYVPGAKAMDKRLRIEAGHL
jgi:predicted metal-dependent hydrolase